MKGAVKMNILENKTDKIYEMGLRKGLTVGINVCREKGFPEWFAQKFAEKYAEGFVIGYNEGFAIGKEESKQQLQKISMLVQTVQKLGGTKELAVQKVIEICPEASSEAQAYVEKFWQS
mgnify:CR=1 FL=1